MGVNAPLKTPHSVRTLMASCQFNPEAIAIWADRKSICFLSDAQREDAYLRAVPFLLEQMKALIEKGWTQISEKPNNDGVSI